MKILHTAFAAITGLALLTVAASAQDSSHQAAKDWLAGKIPVYNGPISYSGEPIEVRFSSFVPQASSVWKTWQPALDRLEQATNGKMKIKLYAGSVLHPAEDGFKAVRDGVADISHCYPAYQPTSFKSLDILQLVGLFNDSTKGSAVAMKLYNKWFKTEYESQDVYLGRLAMTPPYDIVSRKPIITPDDWKGLKIRAAGGATSDLIKAMGAVPTFISASEAYTAMQQGTIDAVTGHDGAFIVFRSAEVATDWSDPKFSAIATAFCINKPFFDNLPADLKPVFSAWFQQWNQIDAQLYFDGFAAEARSKMKEMGLKMHEMTGKQRQAVLFAMEPVNESWVEEREAKGIPAREILADIKATAKEYESKSADEIFMETVKSPLTNLID